MDTSLAKGIEELSLRMRLMRAAQEEASNTNELTEREAMILGLLREVGPRAVSQIAQCYPNFGESTISTDITRLWRDKGMVSKNISPQNQRTTIVELTEKGKNAIDLYFSRRAERFKALLQAVEVSDSEKKILLKVINRAVSFFDKHLGLKAASEKPEKTAP